MSEFVEWGALGQVVLFGLLVGAGLPALFALGVRTLAGPGARGADGEVTIARKVVAYACFGAVVLAVLGAVAYIAAGGH
ncbi:hypothetical protein QQX09_09440 [Demequina sp. SYSU T00192]|uniref:Integral membrane protein n=1 Tax=Demequina litoralis TaxID=3051660 RepID=A0ABT8GAC3_9MICO|nr:hypothetical protein [Demequina sp. SYSU T00192]MDN4476076.1 hypothetical protein [Demequina sp. SYSU T00192]